MLFNYEKLDILCHAYNINGVVTIKSEFFVPDVTGVVVTISNADVEIKDGQDVLHNIQFCDINEILMHW